jgi:murein DD-endopeptidase MepM/ murein hydrolase activator NlpD
LPRPRLTSLAAVLAATCLLVATASAEDGGIGLGGDDTTADGKSNVFPVRAKHSYGDGFGADRGHEGQDIMARCGKPIVAARSGRVKYRGFDGGAGNYLVINGKNTDRDYMYAHLRRRSPFHEGERVRIGEEIGAVGQSGNAVGCHLHFELWRGDWNGQPDVTRKLKLWDSWS